MSAHETHTNHARHRARNTVAWLAIAAVISIAGIVFLGAINDMDGEPLIENPGTVIAAALTALGVLAAAVMPLLLKIEAGAEAARSSSQAVAAIRDNVQNSHVKPDGSPFYLRDDLDDKHEALIQRFSVIDRNLNLALELVQAAGSDIRGVRADIGRVASLAQQTSGKLATLERSHDRALERLHDIDGQGGARRAHPLIGE